MRVDGLTRQLAVELRVADVQSFDLVDAAASEGANSGGAVDIGMLAAPMLSAGPGRAGRLGPAERLSRPRG